VGDVHRREVAVQSTGVPSICRRLRSGRWHGVCRTGRTRPPCTAGSGPRRGYWTLSPGRARSSGKPDRSSSRRRARRSRLPAESAPPPWPRRGSTFTRTSARSTTLREMHVERLRARGHLVAQRSGNLVVSSPCSRAGPRSGRRWARSARSSAPGSLCPARGRELGRRKGPSRSASGTLDVLRRGCASRPTESSPRRRRRRLHRRVT